MNPSLQVDYYSDILCVWAWIAQRRIDEVLETWGTRVHMRFRFVNVFGSALEHIDKRWSERGGVEAFSDHVLEAVTPYESAPVNSRVWRDVRPNTSATAHLVIKAAELTTSGEAAAKLALSMRRAFFVEALDVGSLKVILDIASHSGFDDADLETVMESGQAQAALMADYERSQELNLRGSPCWVLNNGRQVLYGNVGYRILNANIEELIRSPAGEASWC